MWNEIIYPFLSFNGATVQPLKFREGYVIPSHTSLGVWLLIYDGVKVNPG